MLCAHTVRRLKPGSFDAFAERFRPEGEPPPGWVRFDMLRSLDDPDQVVTFGFFDGTLDELEANQEIQGYAERVASVSELVEEVVVNGVYAVEVELVAS